MRDGCAARSRASTESTAGTASRARRWLLVEHGGPWGADVLRDGTLPAWQGSLLRRLASELPARVLLVRRPVERRRQAVAVFAGVTAGPDRWLECVELSDASELADLDVAPLAEHRSLGWEAVTAPLHLVCTNGRHDACCAEYGRPVVDALVPLLGERVWECSHVGGDRFAGNLVVLPSGSLYGRLDPDSARRVVEAHERGQIDLDHWRGHSDLPFPVQAAEAHVRTRLGLTGHHDVVVVGARRLGDARTAVAVRTAAGGHLEAVVHTRAADGEQPLTCGDVPRRAPVHVLEQLVEVEPPAGG